MNIIFENRNWDRTIPPLNIIAAKLINIYEYEDK